MAIRSARLDMAKLTEPERAVYAELSSRLCELTDKERATLRRLTKKCVIIPKHQPRRPRAAKETP